MFVKNYAELIILHTSLVYYIAVSFQSYAVVRTAWHKSMPVSHRHESRCNGLRLRSLLGHILTVCVGFCLLCMSCLILKRTYRTYIIVLPLLERYIFLIIEILQSSFLYVNGIGLQRCPIILTNLYWFCNKLI